MTGNSITMNYFSGYKCFDLSISSVIIFCLSVLSLQNTFIRLSIHYSVKSALVYVIITEKSFNSAFKFCFCSVLVIPISFAIVIDILCNLKTLIFANYLQFFCLEITNLCGSFFFL